MQNFETSLAVRDTVDASDRTRKRKVGVLVVGLVLLVAAGAAIGIYFGLKSSSSSSSSSSSAAAGGGGGVSPTSSTFARGAALNASLRSSFPTSSTLVRGAASLPSSVDWRSNPNAVSPIKNQQQCGCCWAFSTSDAIEAAYGLATGTAIQTVSIQQIVSCDTGNGDQGCNGGDPANALSNYLSNNALTSSEVYPFSDASGTTSSCVKSKVGSADSAHNWFPLQVDASNPVVYVVPQCQGTCKWTSTAEQSLMAALVNGPVSICVDASGWNNYQGGVVDGSGKDAGQTKCTGAPGSDADSSTVDHAVSVVGYNTANSQQYWIVRNQWGTSWGDKGYIYLARGSNTCCILCEAVQTNVKTNGVTPAPVVITTAPPTVGPTSHSSTTTASPSSTKTTPASSTATTPASHTVTTPAASSTTTTSSPVATECTAPATLTNVNYACYTTDPSTMQQNDYACLPADNTGTSWCCYDPPSFTGSGIKIASYKQGSKTLYATCKYQGGGGAPAPPSSSSSSGTQPPVSTSTTSSSSSNTCSSLSVNGLSIDASCCAMDASNNPYSYGCIVEGCCLLMSTLTGANINQCLTGLPAGITAPTNTGC